MKKIIKSIILAIIIQFSLSYIPVIEYSLPKYANSFIMKFIASLELSVHSFGLENFIICIALTYLIYHRYKKEQFNYESIITIVFTIICLISKTVMYTGSIKYLCNNLINLFFTIVCFIGYYTILKILVDFVYDKIFTSREIVLKDKFKKIYDFVFEVHPFIMPIIIIFIAYLPYIIITFPGTVSYDGYFQLIQFFINSATNHHPFLSTIFFYCLYSIGDIFLLSKDAIFSIIIFQIIMQLVAYGLIFKIFKEEKVSNIYRILSLVFIMLFVVLKIGTVTVVKDTLFQTGLILFVISIYYYLKNVNCTKSLFLLLYSSLFLYLFKNNSLNVIVLSLLVLLLKERRVTRIAFNIFLITLLLGINTYYHNYFMPKFNISEASKTESVFVEMQCVSRYLKYYHDDLTSKEKEVLSKVFIDEALDYNPENVDSIKKSINPDCDNKCIRNFKRVWISLGIRHPLVYLDSFFNLYYGYLYPSKAPYYNTKYNLDGLGTYISFNYPNDMVVSKLKNPNASLMLQSIGNTKMRTPFISFFYNCAICSWILILLIGYNIKNKSFKNNLFIIPIIICWISLFLGPANAFIRYVYPLYIPILFSLGLIVYRVK